ncbi:acetate/propionate family kinase [Phyllobacterium sp. SB3]|uniref:acetate/propionate family kinase n=1 Tax=Phyllobacterium sp. SB3 TaxID=3156073 RepID=UPI0032B020DD
MTETILVVNAGSSSLKYALFEQSEELRPLLRGSISSLDEKPRMTVSAGGGNRTVDIDLNDGAINIKQAMNQVIAHLADRDLLRKVTCVGHRIVHGGQHFKSAVLLDEPTMKQLRELAPLAPMHQPRNIAIIDTVQAVLPSTRQFGCFDTAFHHTRPQLAKIYGLPRELTDSGMISYGFHGLSYSYIASCLKARFGAEAGGRVIVAHLGSGASLCALVNGASAATTMGFSPLDGLVMSTRSGSIDPGVILHLLQHRKMAVEHVAHLLQSESGLLGVSGVSGDMQALIASKQPSANEAIDLFVYRITQAIGSLAASMSGLDMLVFCAGIGEHSPLIRAKVGEGAGWLGVEIDAQRNSRSDETISSVDSKVKVLALPTDEERAVAKELRFAFGRP